MIGSLKRILDSLVKSMIVKFLWDRKHAHHIIV